MSDDMYMNCIGLDGVLASYVDSRVEARLEYGGRRVRGDDTK